MRAAAFAVGLSWAAPASAGEDALARADALFAHGKRLLEEGAVAEACAAFEESYAIEATGGTLLNLAVCYERQGRYATAEAAFVTALAKAEEDGRNDRIRVARRHLADVTPRVAHVVLVFGPEQDRAAIALALDGVPWEPTSWEAPRALDPGAHRLVIREGGDEREVIIEVPARGGRIEVRLALERARPPAPAPRPRPRKRPAAPEPAEAPAWLVPVGATGLGLGAAGLVVGVGFGIHAVVRAADVEAGCTGAVCSDPALVDANHEVDRSATVADVALVAGGFVAAGGVALLVAAWILDDPHESVAADGLRIRW